MSCSLSKWLHFDTVTSFLEMSFFKFRFYIHTCHSFSNPTSETLQQNCQVALTTKGNPPPLKCYLRAKERGRESKLDIIFTKSCETMDSFSYHNSSFVAAHALGYMMHSNSLLIPLNQRVLNISSKEHKLADYY